LVDDGERLLRKLSYGPTRNLQQMKCVLAAARAKEACSVDNPEDTLTNPKEAFATVNPNPLHVNPAGDDEGNMNIHTHDQSHQTHIHKQTHEHIHAYQHKHKSRPGALDDAAMSDFEARLLAVLLEHPNGLPLSKLRQKFQRCWPDAPPVRCVCVCVCACMYVCVCVWMCVCVCVCLYVCS
jgi:hypothetical protein